MNNNQLEILDNCIEANIQITYSRSSGPGGQNVNKLNTKVTAHLPVSCLSFLQEEDLSRLRLMLANRISKDDQIVLYVQESRSQAANRITAIMRLKSLIQQALKRNKKRIAVKIPYGINEKRLQAKKLHSRKKDFRHNLDD